MGFANLKFISRKKNLFLLSDNMEYRATGRFIISYQNSAYTCTRFRQGIMKWVLQKLVENIKNKKYYREQVYKSVIREHVKRICILSGHPTPLFPSGPPAFRPPPL